MNFKKIDEQKIRFNQINNVCIHSMTFLTVSYSIVNFCNNYIKNYIKIFFN